jgi:hypothetical protein
MEGGYPSSWTENCQSAAFTVREHALAKVAQRGERA